MRYRALGLAAAVLLAAPLMSSCLNPRPPGGTTTTTTTGNPPTGLPAPVGKDCGTIHQGVPSNENATAATCYMEYHVFSEIYVRVITAGTTTTTTSAYQAIDHNTTITTIVTDNATGAIVSSREKKCFLTGGQFLMDRTGVTYSNCPA